MQQRSGAQISQKAFIQSFIILIIIMIFAGVLTRLVPAGSYSRIMSGGREVIDPASFTFQAAADYPIWRWFTAPVEVLAGPDGLTVITIILFLLMVGASFAVLDGSGILRAVIAGIVVRFGGRKYLLLMAISLFFMLMGAFFGIFEEVLPLVPIMIALSLYLGWDTLVGLGMSILAVNMGFSAAVTNPFTIGVAQKLAGLPLFSGALLRMFFFVIIYGIFAWFLTAYAKRVERKPEIIACFSRRSGLQATPSTVRPAAGIKLRHKTWKIAGLVWHFYRAYYDRSGGVTLHRIPVFLLTADRGSALPLWRDGCGIL